MCSVLVKYAVHTPKQLNTSVHLLITQDCFGFMYPPDILASEKGRSAAKLLLERTSQLLAPGSDTANDLVKGKLGMAAALLNKVGLVSPSLTL